MENAKISRDQIIFNKNKKGIYEKLPSYKPHQQEHSPLNHPHHSILYRTVVHWK